MHAQKLVEKGNDAFERGAYDLAIELYMQAVTLEPDHLEGRRGLRKAELKKVEAYYPGALSRNLGTFGPKLAALFAGLVKSHEKKMIALENALVKDPKNVALSAALAAAAEKAGHKNAGIAAWEGVLENEPNNLTALKGLGRLLYQTGDPHRALEVYEKAIKIDPRDQEASRMRKNVAAEVSITKTGIDRAKSSRDLMNDAEKQTELHDEARVVRGADHIRESADKLAQQVAIDPDNGKLVAELAAQYAAIREYDKAIETYERAYELVPTNFGLREKAGELRISRFDREIAAAEEAGDTNRLAELKAERLDFTVEEFRKRTQEHPTDLGIRYRLARALHEHGDVDDAIAQYQQTVKDPRRKIDSLTELGNCFIAKGLFDLAENQLVKALEETPGLSGRGKDILYSLGLLKEKQGLVDEALAEYKKIYEVDINYRDIAEKMTTLKQNAGD
ncbi:MAG: tetratricopeptide repeat protein [Planctomycetota bacterium]